MVLLRNERSLYFPIRGGDWNGIVVVDSLRMARDNRLICTINSLSLEYSCSCCGITCGTGCGIICGTGVDGGNDGDEVDDVADKDNWLDEDADDDHWLDDDDDDDDESKDDGLDDDDDNSDECRS